MQLVLTIVLFSFCFAITRSTLVSLKMASGPGLGGSMSGMFDPSVLFDLDDILMAGDCSNDMHTSLVHTPIKEEPEYDQDDSRYCYAMVNQSKVFQFEFYLNRYVHSPIGLPIPSRNAGTAGVDSGFASIKQETGGLIGESPAGLWAGQREGMIPFPVTPFNTPAHGTPAFPGNDLMRSFFLSNPSHQLMSNPQHLNNANNPLTIKEEFIGDLEPNLEVMKV